MAKNPTVEVHEGSQVEQSAPAPSTAMQWYKNPLVYFAAISAVAAGTSAWAAITNMDTAKKQVAITRMQYTPQLGLGVGDLSGYGAGPYISTQARIKNVGTITIYNAEVAGAVDLLAVSDVQKIWASMKARDQGATLGPTEEEVISITGSQPVGEQRAEIEAGGRVIVAAARIRYTDELGRSHSRYACTQFVRRPNGLIGSFCPTPPQN